MLNFEFPPINEETEEEFHEWRSKGLGSSDMPIILGVSPYKTKHKLWLEKTGIKPSDFEGNYATQRGKDLEPEVRSWFNKEFNCHCSPERKIHDEYDYLRANADGVDWHQGVLIEIKCGGLDDHIAACEENKVPDKYYPQLMFLSHVFKLPIYYVSYNGGYEKKKYTAFLVPRDEKFTNDMLEKAHEFWRLVRDKTDPGLSNKDDFIIESGEIMDLVKSYGELKEEGDSIKGKLEAVKKIIKTKLPHSRVVCGGYRLTWNAKGNFIISKLRGNDDG